MVGRGEGEVGRKGELGGHWLGETQGPGRSGKQKENT